jgi:hypothetical protein
MARYSISHSSWHQLCAAFLALVLWPGMVRAQDVFSAGDVQIYTDQFSSNCIKSQRPNIWKQLGVDPLTCHPLSMPQDSNKQCSLRGVTLVKHIGTMCYYCEPQIPPGTLYIPQDQAHNASMQGYTCGVSPVDPGCMAVCWQPSNRNTTYVPPSSQPTRVGGGATASDQPCHRVYDLSTPVGRAAMQANAARDAAECNEFRCKHNPQLEVCKTTTTGGGSSPPNQAPCGNFFFMKPYTWPARQAKTLENDLTAAKAILQKAQARVARVPWDRETAAVARKYFGDSSSSIQGLMQLYIANALKLANKMGQGGRENATFYPDPIPLANYGRQAPSATVSYWDITEPKVFLTSLYWNQPDAGSDSRAMVLVHEISHTPLAGETSDYAYGEGSCQLLVYQATSPFPSIIQAMGLKVVERDVPLKNASSFQYFVYALSELK